MSVDLKMESQKEHDIVDRVVSAETLEESQKAYSKWAKTYDRDLGNLKRNTPGVVVKALMELTSVAGSSQQRILDLAAGTGAMGEELRKQGFEGQIDALDGNKQLLTAAREKKIYSNLTEQLLLPDLNVNVEHNAYDFIICIGALFPNHVPYQIVPKMVPHMKKNGYLIYSLWGSETIADYKAKLQSEMEKLVGQEIMNLKSTIQYSHFTNVDVRMSEESSRQTLYCYQKL